MKTHNSGQRRKLLRMYVSRYISTLSSTWNPTVGLIADQTLGNDVRLTILPPVLASDSRSRPTRQMVIAKGKLGQYKLLFSFPTVPPKLGGESTNKSTIFCLAPFKELDERLRHLVFQKIQGQPFLCENSTFSLGDTENVQFPSLAGTTYEDPETKISIGSTKKTSAHKVYRNAAQRSLLPVQRAITSAITGITQGFAVNLELEGIGYQALILLPETQTPAMRRGAGLGGLAGYISKLFSPIVNPLHVGKTLKKRESTQLLLDLGWSHSASYSIPEKDVLIVPTDLRGSAESTASTKIAIQGISNARTNEVAAEICAFHKCEPYKGKGIRIRNPNGSRGKAPIKKKPA